MLTHDKSSHGLWPGELKSKNTGGQSINLLSQIKTSNQNISVMNQVKHMQY